MRTTPLPELAPIGVTGLTDIGPMAKGTETFAQTFDAASISTREAQIRDIVATWIAGGWTWHIEGTKAITLFGSSNFDVRITHKFRFDRGAYEDSEIVCQDDERGLYLVVACPPSANRGLEFDHAPLHRLADAMIGMGIELPLGVEEKIAGDRLSEVRS